MLRLLERSKMARTMREIRGIIGLDQKMFQGRWVGILREGLRECDGANFRRRVPRWLDCQASAIKTTHDDECYLATTHYSAIHYPPDMSYIHILYSILLTLDCLVGGIQFLPIHELHYPFFFLLSLVYRLNCHVLGAPIPPMDSAWDALRMRCPQKSHLYLIHKVVSYRIGPGLSIPRRTDSIDPSAFTHHANPLDMGLRISTSL